VTRRGSTSGAWTRAALGACLKKRHEGIVFPQFAGAAFDVDIPIVVTAGEQR